MHGKDPAGLELAVVPAAEQAELLLAPERVPEPLVRALAEEWDRAGRHVEVLAQPGLPLTGRPLAEALVAANPTPHPMGDEAEAHGEHEAHAGHGVPAGGGEHEAGADHGTHSVAVESGAHGGHGTHAGHGDHGTHADAGHGTHTGNGADAGHAGHGGHGHGGHDHHDMMAIVGEPSADGLVMEAIDLRIGPLSGVLPGGLVVAVSLDGDVVDGCVIEATLRAGRDVEGGMPDPLAAVAWRAADAVAAGLAAGGAAPARVQWQRLAAVEHERALSHLVWLRSLARLLGWAQLVDEVQRAVDLVAPLHCDAEEHLTPGALPDARNRAASLLATLGGRRFAWRTRGRGVVPAAAHALTGPNARAAGGTADARATDPLYRALGFRVVVEEAGDVRARALVRAREAVAALELAAAALERAEALPSDGADVPIAFAAGATAVVEGPRGPVQVTRERDDASPVHAAPGASTALTAAGEAARGQEWSAALLTIASFDLSPWTVDG